MRSPSLRVERARPLLGTIVSVRVEGLSEADAHRAIGAAFAEVALVHGLMSFQESTSEIARLNREAHVRAQDVHPATYEVLHAAQSIAEASGGIFDITTAGPHHSIGRRPGADAHWTDVQLADDYTVRFRKPLLIDVSGIAKGYAVDRAVAVLQHHGASRGAVNAGGDLRIFGSGSERVALRPPRCPNDSLPVIEIENAAMASSSGEVQPGCHIDPRDGQPFSPDRFAAVIAESCMIADALTKPALILRERSENLLSRYGACAHLHAPGAGWMHLGAAP